MPRSEAPPHLVLCGGLKSSGSTWLYNAVIQVLETASESADTRIGCAVLPFYSENLKSFPNGAENARYVVVKTHIPSDSLQFLARFVHATVFISVREPRDAIASLMQRFRHKFSSCLRGVALGADRMVGLSNSGPINLLRYEDRFFDDPEAVSRIAGCLDIPLSLDARNAIFDSLTRHQVRARIEALCKDGVFGKRPNPNRFDPKTHWHPGHIGDSKIGKYRDLLSRDQQRAVLERTVRYCDRFGYSAGLSKP